MDAKDSRSQIATARTSSGFDRDPKKRPESSQGQFPKATERSGHSRPGTGEETTIRDGPIEDVERRSVPL
eukprot:1737935-Prorocentrum_lima.AAC.1